MDFAEAHWAPSSTMWPLDRDLAMKKRALKSLQEPPERRLRFHATDRLLAFLDGL